MFALSENITRFFGLVAICGLCIAVGYGYGVHSATEKYNGVVQKQRDKNDSILAKAVDETEKQTRALYEDKIKHIRRRVTDTYVLSADFRMLLDSYTGLPEVSTAQTVTPEQIANGVRDNYYNCRQNIIWLKECNAICQ